jgi:uncharacterized damage-inducible protein DinB
METKNKNIKKYQRYISFVESLRNLDEELWTTPIAENKWSVRDIIGHIMFWDKYTQEEAIMKIKTNQPVTVDDVNIDEFNQKAVEYVKTTDKDEIINHTVQYRQEIIETLKILSEETFFNNYIDSSGNNFSINNFLEEFITHDDHHKRQIEKFLNSR